MVKKLRHEKSLIISGKTSLLLSKSPSGSVESAVVENGGSLDDCGCGDEGGSGGGVVGGGAGGRRVSLRSLIGGGRASSIS